MARREYPLVIVVNRQLVTKVIIDPHYELKHSKSVTDEIILELVLKLNGKRFLPEEINGDFTYFKYDRLMLKNKLYKLVWLMEYGQTYIGIVNAHRR